MVPNPSKISLYPHRCKYFAIKLIKNFIYGYLTCKRTSDRSSHHQWHKFLYQPIPYELKKFEYNPLRGLFLASSSLLANSPIAFHFSWARALVAVKFVQILQFGYKKDEWSRPILQFAHRRGKFRGNRPTTFDTVSVRLHKAPETLLLSPTSLLRVS